MPADVAIYGAGPAGCATALELCRLGRRVVVVRKPKPATARTIGECLPAAASVLLERLQLPLPDSRNHLPSAGNESTWGSTLVAANQSILNPYGSGWHLDRNYFDESLRQELERHHIPVVLEPAEVRFAVDCTGRGSALAVTKGARLLGNDRLVSFAIAAGGNEHDQDSTTFTEAVAGGWWYTARLTHNRRVAAFQTDGDLPQCQVARTRKGFLALLRRTAEVNRRLTGYLIQKADPVALPAGGRRLDRATGNCWAAVGDAAQCYDPLSSQGLLRVFESAHRAAFAIHCALDDDLRHLHRYQTLLELEWLRYERLRLQFYGLEHRWPESTFWQRRSGRA